MRVVYAETSALLTWLLEEEALRGLAAAIDAAEKVATSVLTVLEAHRGIVCAKLQRRITSSDALRLEGLLVRAASAWELMELTAEVRARAGRPFPAEPVRTLAAIHLATALHFAKVFPDLSVLTLDERIVSNLEPLGLLNAIAE